MSSPKAWPTTGRKGRSVTPPGRAGKLARPVALGHGPKIERGVRVLALGYAALNIVYAGAGRIWRRATAAGNFWRSHDRRWVTAFWPPTQSARVVGFTAAFAVVLAGMFVWMAWHSRQIIIIDTYNSSSNLALSLEQFVARTMESVDLTVRVVAEEVGAGVAITPQEIQRLLADRVRESPALTGLMVTGPDGHVRFSSVRLMPQSLDLVNKDVFASARNSASLQLGVGEPLTPGYRARHQIFVSRRFNRADGKLAGVVIATLDAGYLERYFSTLHIGQNGTIAVHKIDGTLLVSRPSRDDDIGRIFDTSPLIRGMLPWASSGVFPEHYEADGLRRIMGYQRLETFPMVVDVALSEDDALANWRRMTGIQAAVGAAILVAFGFMAFALKEMIGELSAARLTAEEASRVKGQFLANMSHELRTPLNAVIGYSALLLEDAEAEGMKAQSIADLRRISSAGEHLLSLVNDVLDISKIEAGKMDLSAQAFDLEALIDDVSATCRLLVTEKGNEFIVQRGGNLGTIVGDATKLRQVVLNLLSNAAKFTKDGVVTLEAVREHMATADWIRISVRDTGIGISRENLPKLFQNFGQFDGNPSTKHGGTGLGLALSQKLCRMMGGEIAVESERGRGSCFTVRIPAGPTGSSAEGRGG